jgi:hypothetical protein
MLRLTGAQALLFGVPMHHGIKQGIYEEYFTTLSAIRPDQ